MSQKYIWIFLLLVALSGCASRLYQGDPLPTSEVSIIKGSGWSQGVYILGKDHKGDPVGSSNVEVMPGWQNINVHYYNIFKGVFYGRDSSVAFDAERGHKYIVKGGGRRRSSLYLG